VDEALDDAVFENGYRDLMDEQSLTVAFDLIQNRCDLENENFVAIADCVVDYQDWYSSHSDVPTIPRTKWGKTK